MINVSNEFKKQLAADNRNYLEYADITLKDGTVLNLTNRDLWNGGLSVEDAVSSESSFDIGSAIINKGTLTINNIYDEFSDYVFEDAEVVAYVGLELPYETTEKIRKGTYAVDEPSYNGSIITLSCLDNMRKFDRPYSESTLAYPATLSAIVRDACSVCGVTLQTVSFPHDDFVIQTRPTDEATTFREVISWAAQIAGCFCRCDVYGRLEVKWYDQTALENPSIVDWSAENPEGTENAHWIKSNYSAPVVSLEDVVITGVQVIEKNESENTEEQLTTYQSGTDGYVISIEDNELIKNGAGQTVAGWLGEQLIGVKFRKATVIHASDPTIEAGDIAVVTDRKGNNYNIIVSSTKFSTGASQNTVSAAENPARNSAVRYSAQTKTYVEWRKAIGKEKSEREKALDDLADRLANSPGVFTTVETQSDGSKVYYLHNKPNLSESDMVWKMTAEAWGVSTSKDEEGNFIWNAGMTVDGDTIVRILTAIGVNAKWINAGAITVKDASGNIVFQVDMDTKSVIISGDSIKIGNQTLPDALEDIKKEAIPLTVSLDNEYQTISTDYEGNYADFPEVKTTVQAYYGQQDISADCIFTIAVSAGIEGTWDNISRTYTVTDLTADNGWVDITASYLDLFSTTKRFNVAKIKAGIPGERGDPGRTYFIEASSNVLKRSKDNSIAPNFIEFKAYYRDGTSATRTAYSGRFIIEETADGETWNTIYTSESDENAVMHYLYSMLANASGNVISTANGSTIGIPRDVISVRCKLYASGGTTVLMDMQSVAVVLDVDALTHEEIFNLLTNNGEVKGIYQEGDQLYISFTYAKGGNLDLGGSENTNGILRVYDGSGNLIGQWDNAGIFVDGGSIRSETDRNAIEIYGGKMLLTYGDLDIGRVGIGDTLDNAYHGLSFSLDSDGEYIAWTKRGDDSSTFYALLYYTRGNGTFGDGAEGLHLVRNLYVDGYKIDFDGVGDVATFDSGIYFRMQDGKKFAVSTIDTVYFSVTTETINCHANLDMHSNSILNSSDERLKTNIVESEISALDVINAIRLYEFDWLENGEHENLGFVAQQLEAEVDANFTVIDENTEKHSVKEMEMIPYLVKSVQELTEQVKELKQEISALKGENVSTVLAKSVRRKWTPTEYTDEEKEAFLNQIMSAQDPGELIEPEPTIIHESDALKGDLI